MAKRKYNVDSSERVKVAEAEEVQVPETVRIVLLRDLKLNYTGPVTGKLYAFSGGGSVLPINVEDAEIMLAKRGGKCCPGGSGSQPYFIKEG